MSTFTNVPCILETKLYSLLSRFKVWYVGGIVLCLLHTSWIARGCHGLQHECASVHISCFTGVSRMFSEKQVRTVRNKRETVRNKDVSRCSVQHSQPQLYLLCELHPFLLYSIPLCFIPCFGHGFYLGNVDLKTKTKKRASHSTSKMSLFRNSKGITMQDKQTMANHRQVQRTAEKGLHLRGKEEVGRGRFRQFRVATASHWVSMAVSDWQGYCWARRNSSFLLLGYRQ